MKILLLNYEYPPLGGGAAAQTRLLARQFAQRGHDVRVLTSHYRGLPLYESNDGFKVFRVPCFRRHKDRSGIFQMFMFLKFAWLPYLWLLLGWKPDVVLTFFLLPTGSIPYFGKIFSAAPYVLSFRGGDIHSFLVKELAGKFRLFKPIARMIGLKAAARVAVSKDLADMAQQVFPEFGVEVIENAVPLQPVSGERKPDVTTFLFIGRLSFEKNLPLILVALSRLTGDFRLEIIGDGPLYEMLSRQVDELGLTGKVRFHGWQDREYVHRWMRKAHYLLLLSKVEGMSMAGLEAYSFGLPVIGSKSPGMADFVVDGVTGYQVDTDDIAAVAKKLEELSRRPELSLEMSGNCRKLIRERYSIEKAADEYLDVFARVLGRDAPSTPLRMTGKGNAPSTPQKVTGGKDTE